MNISSKLRLPMAAGLGLLFASLASLAGCDDSSSTLDGAVRDGAAVDAQPVDLGSAGTFAILSKAGVSTTAGSSITGDVGVSPAAASFITGFDLTADATSVFATSPMVTGRIYAADYAAPTPAGRSPARWISARPRTARGSS